MKKDFAHLLLYVFGFFLLWEWLRPLEQLTETDNTMIFILFIGLAFLLSYFEVNRLVSFLIKGLYVLNAIHFLFYKGSIFHKAWFADFSANVKKNITFVLAADWNALTSIFRSLMFFILLWLMVYLIHYWLLHRKRIFVFFLMTLIYITVLDTFTTYKGNGAIVRTLVIGFAVLGILTFFRLLTKENMAKDRAYTGKWMVPLSIMIAFSTLIGFAAPKAAPIWPDPVPYLKSYSEQAGEGSGGVKKIGYGTDDTRLGGPFIGDNQIVYRINTKEKSYWKVESKDVYTGKGWEISNSGEPISFVGGEQFPLAFFDLSVKTTEAVARVNTFNDYTHIAYPMGVKIIDAGFLSVFQIHPFLEKVFAFNTETEPLKLDRYELTYQIPEYSVTKLMENNSAGTKLTSEMENRYLQLPPELPDRIKKLAQEITAGKTNWFDQAKAIENYFDRDGFTYDQKEVAVPKKNQDYVDQFLFDTKKGYCDNFSTSMVVLLRSLGIPARWVKGYSEGELLDSVDNVYEITNNNAHSWVEVYFPNQGWVTFEPTIGFTNNAEFKYDNNKSTPAQAAKPVTAAPKPEVDRMEKLKDDKKEESKTFSLKNIWGKVKAFFIEHWVTLMFVAILLAAAIVFLYRIRSKWMPYYLVYRFRSIKDDGNLAPAYLALLKQLELYGLKRKENQTLRDYARYIDTFFSTKEMTRLTDRYEQYLYKRVLTEGTWKDSKELWENLIKKTIA